MQASSSPLRWANILAAAALALLLAGHAFSTWVTRYRPLHFDESQYLHVAWMMEHGQRLYIDFIEDHSPFLFLIFRPLLPETAPGEHLDLLEYAARARAVTSLCGVLALAAIGLLAYRASRSVLAPLIAVALLLTSILIWMRGLADARNDPPSLLLFWLGAWLLIDRWKSGERTYALAGTGIGLAIVAALWNPKMPVECLVLGAFYLWRLRQAFRAGLKMVALAVLPAIALAGAAILVIAATTTLRDYLRYTFELNFILGDFDRRFFGPERPFLYCAKAFKGVPVILLLAAPLLLLVPRIRNRIRAFDFRAYGVVYALAVAALLDIRFLFPYPNLWAQYYLMWSFAAAALYGMTAAAVVSAIGRARIEAFVQVAAALVAVPLVITALPDDSGAEEPWIARAWIQQNLRPGETVWLTPEVHPIDARDASYYWFAFADLVPASLEYVASNPRQDLLPKATQFDLPVCRAEKGLEPNLRFVSGLGSFESIPLTRRCLERMIASGRARRTLVRDVWDLKPSGP